MMTDALGPAGTDFLARLQARLPSLVVNDAQPHHLEEPRGKWRGRPGPVAYPRSVEEVSAIVTQANTDGVGVVPYGGGTGLVGGQVMSDGALPILVSLEKMTAVRAVYPGENAIIVEAGVTIDAVQNAARDVGRMFPLAYASSGSARIGGALSVNSGGLNVLRYGMARDLALGIEAVLPNGDILHGLKRLRKDNTGFDLRHLLIGAEGTLGIITAASLKLLPEPGERATALLNVSSPAAAMALLNTAKGVAGEMISAFELIGGMGLRFLREVLPDLRQPLGLPPPDWAVLIEIETPKGVGAREMLLEVFEQGLVAELISDGNLAESETQRAEFWAVREAIPEANRRIGAIASHDISLPLSEVAGYIERTSAELAAYRINVFGHLGDGNLHFNVFAPEEQSPSDFRDYAAQISRLIHDNAAAVGGSFSAEHGVGRAKTGDLARYGDPAKLTAMRAIKAALDPKGIMNPGVIFG